MKKIRIILAVITMIALFSFCGCGTADTTDNGVTDNNTVQNDGSDNETDTDMNENTDENAGDQGLEEPGTTE